MENDPNRKYFDLPERQYRMGGFPDVLHMTQNAKRIMNRIVLSLLLFVSSLSWAEECFEGSQIQISGKIISVERKALPELDVKQEFFFKRYGEILSFRNK